MFQTWEYTIHLTDFQGKSLTEQVWHLEMPCADRLVQNVRGDR